jgi:ABC-type hemin transport system ATPase subunit
MHPDTLIIIGEREGWGETRPFGISATDHCHHVYIIGKTGSGKTTLLRNLLIQHIMHQWGHPLALPMFSACAADEAGQNAFMPRQMRIEYLGAIYHVISRGGPRRADLPG